MFPHAGCSYLYQAAILGLSAMGDIFAEEVIPILVRSFLNELLSEETRLKLGETLVRVGERCGEALPKWGPYIYQKLPFKLSANPCSPILATPPDLHQATTS